MAVQIDLAQVRPDGNAVFAGKAAPNAKVTVFEGDVVLGTTTADENGEWSFLAPAGKIRVSAFVGTFDPEPARATFSDGSYMQLVSNDLLSETNDARQINAITAILGNVANMTWLGETHYNVTGEQANRQTGKQANRRTGKDSRLAQGVIKVC